MVLNGSLLKAIQTVSALLSHIYTYHLQRPHLESFLNTHTITMNIYIHPYTHIYACIPHHQSDLYALYRYTQTSIYTSSLVRFILIYTHTIISYVCTHMIFILQ